MKPAGLVNFQVTIAESDLHISAESPLGADAYRSLRQCRQALEAYIADHPEFRASLAPLAAPNDAPDLVKKMARAAQAAGVGPMAAVAGAVAEAVGRDLLRYSSEVIVENGGDIFLRSLHPRTIAVYAGQSPFSMKIALEAPPSLDGLGVCTSAATVGHSLSFGKADAVVIIAPDAALADAWATAIGNMVKSKDDVSVALERISGAEGVIGALVIIGDALGAWGQVQLRKL
jgi:uncharacterized protein